VSAALWGVRETLSESVDAADCEVNLLSEPGPWSAGRASRYSPSSIEAKMVAMPAMLVQLHGSMQVKATAGQAGEKLKSEKRQIL
jgi:hypothetical protein